MKKLLDGKIEDGFMHELMNEEIDGSLEGRGGMNG